ncbi:MAG: PQQ-binding-like beta-propeller repeat protein [Phycisphaerae bacterium]|jgi:hypothetical protein|nr:PQQ-binding-like beta-propeller repeat protein [Phycisphaerae bacterium]MDP7289178.1 PQQ-binding-like beta-propeller repeat protein [Phycisphaerae bacterium]
MLKKSLFCACSYIAVAVLVGQAAVNQKTPAAKPAEALIKGQLRHTVIAADGHRGKVLKISPEGKIVWEFKAPRCHDAWLLENGNVLATYGGRGVGGAMEISPDNKIVWKYEVKGEVQTAQRLADGNTLMGDPTRGRLIEISKEGKIVKEVKLKYKRGGHALMRHARKLKCGNYLVAHHHNKVICEYAPDGKVVMEIKTEAPAFAAVRLANGNTMCSEWFRIKEVDPKGKIVWSMTKKEIVEQLVPGGKEVEKGDALMTGIQVLSNGNIVIANYFGHGKGSRGAVLFEVTRDKKVVWQYTNKKDTGGVMGVHIVDAKKPHIR